MKISKLEYALTKACDAYSSSSKKQKYEKVKKNLEMFYKEGCLDKNEALKVRDDILGQYSYKNRSKKVSSIVSFIGLVFSRDCFAESFRAFCNKYKETKRLFNLE